MWQSLKNLYHFFVAALAVLFYRFPGRKLKVIGVTGTDGKTTTVHLIYHLLKSSGEKASMISSVKAAIGEKEYETGFHVTTPDPWEVQKYLYQAHKDGSEYMVLEVTSHALDQNRVAFCNFQIGVLTNVTHEHLDYHKTYKNYVKAKIKLLENSRIAIVNRDDESFRYVKETKINAKKSKLATYGLKGEADFTPQNFPFKTSLIGEFNKYNVLAASAVAKSLGLKKEAIKKAIATFRLPQGRMEVVVKKPFIVVIDFAHTPNALENLLKALKDQTKGKIITVFGCAGLRDEEKRSKMGKISAKLADNTVLTAEDPRTEDVGKIIDQIAQGCVESGGQEKENFWRISDRQKAIDFAIQKLACPEDLVVITGKGHEKSMCFGKREYPWSDHEAVQKALVGKK